MIRQEQGSVFLEALVATTVVAAAVVALFGVVEASALRHRGLEARRMALMIARSELDAVGAALPIAPGQAQGVESDYRWRVQIEAPLPSPLAIGNAGAVYPVDVTVGPAKGGADLVVLRTLKLAAVP